MIWRSCKRDESKNISEFCNFIHLSKSKRLLTKNPIAILTIRSFKGLINHTEEVGLFITSGRFTNEAERFAREANFHIKLINGEELITLWQQFYLKLTDDDKNMLPLQPIYFLGANDT